MSPKAKKVKHAEKPNISKLKKEDKVLKRNVKNEVENMTEEEKALAKLLKKFKKL